MGFELTLVRTNFQLRTRTIFSNAVNRLAFRKASPHSSGALTPMPLFEQLSAIAPTASRPQQTVPADRQAPSTPLRTGSLRNLR